MAVAGPVATLADFEAAGFYDPQAPGASDRRALCEYLMSLGVTASDLQLVGTNEPAVLAMLAVLFPNERAPVTLEDLARDSGLSLETVQRFWRACGFADAPPGAPAALGAGSELFQALAASVQLFGEEATLQYVRVLGAAAARVADAGVSLFVSNAAAEAAARDASYVTLARLNAESVALVPAVVAGFDMLLRHHMFAARRSDAFPTDGVDVQQRSVGFVDLVGSTGLTVGLTPQELAAAFGAFDATCSDIVVGLGGRVVKHIGDEVMFAVGEPSVAVEIALALLDAFAQHPLLPPARAAVACGSVVTRDGDYSGVVVNRAARAVKLARPNSLLVDIGVRDALGGLPFGARKVGAFSLKGFDERVPLYRVKRERTGSVPG